ncbi:MAG: TIGR03564 family F420-dependent LLM class oxidoreductase [Dehalococcoidia bacterium]|nr:TIGR03564 family F420-dependent LLM class oxidoreductase [Dehalococcoidia bacterium]
MRIGIGVETGASLDQTLENFRRAEADGFASAWASNIFGYDAISLLALAGRVTERIELGTFVVPTYPRHPVAIAQQALTTSAAAPGRFTLGIGLSHKVVIEDMFGLDYSRPARHMREYLSVLNPLLAGEATRFTGDEYRVAARFEVPGAPKPSLVIAALGPQMLKLAGSMADGTATWMGGPRYLRETAIPAIRAAAAEAGRPEPRIVAGFPVALTSNVDAALEAAAHVFQVYGQLPSYRAVLDVEGAANPADIAIVGGEDEVRRQVRELAEAGVTDFNASVFGVREDPEAPARTREFLAELARSEL